MVKASVPAIGDGIVDTVPELALVEIDTCGMVVRVKEGKTVRVGRVVVEPVLELGLGLIPKKLDAEPVEPVLKLGLGGFPTELDAEPTPGGG